MTKWNQLNLKRSFDAWAQSFCGHHLVMHVKERNAKSTKWPVDVCWNRTILFTFGHQTVCRWKPSALLNASQTQSMTWRVNAICTKVHFKGIPSGVHKMTSKRTTITWMKKHHFSDTPPCGQHIQPLMCPSLTKKSSSMKKPKQPHLPKINWRNKKPDRTICFCIVCSQLLDD